MNQFLHASRVVLKSGDPDPVGGFAGRELELGYIDPSFSGPAEGAGVWLAGESEHQPAVVGVT
jgi:hypothetical protein